MRGKTGGPEVSLRPAVYVVPVLVLALLAAACTNGDDDSRSERSPSPAGSPMGEGAATSPTVEPKPEKPKLRVVGNHRLGGKGFNGDVWALGDFAYVGNWGGVFDDAACPASGVKVVDISDPRKPKMVSRLRNPPNTTSEDVVVRRVETEEFTADIATVGIQACGLGDGPRPERFRGLQFFDVTDPRNPKELSRWKKETEAAGCHEVDMNVARGRVLATCALPFGRQVGDDEVFVVDVGKPRHPKELFGWSLPVDPRSGVGCFSASIAHSARFSENGKLLYVSYWDAGTPILDIRKPRKPRLLGTIEENPRDADGDNHSVAEAPRGLLIVLHEDFSPALPEARFTDCGSRFGSWGKMRIFNVKDPRKPRLVSQFGTKNSRRSEMKKPRIYSVHNAEVVGRDQVFLSWYSDGVRWVDIGKPRKPKELAGWAPRARRDPNGFFPKETLVWGVYPIPDSELILASDINSGLWILRARGLQDRLEGSGG